MELAGDPADRGFLQADVLVIIVALSVGFKIIVFGIILCFVSKAVNDDGFVSRWIQEDSPILFTVPFPFGRNSKGSAANGKGNRFAGRSGGSAVRRLAETLLEAALEEEAGFVDLLLFSSTNNTTINTMIKAAIPNTMPKTSLLDFLGGVGP